MNGYHVGMIAAALLMIAVPFFPLLRPAPSPDRPVSPPRYTFSVACSTDPEASCVVGRARETEGPWECVEGDTETRCISPQAVWVPVEADGPRVCIGGRCFP